MSNNNELFRILSIDGGGVRGVYPATILSHLERNLGRSIAKNFDLIIGTSTGAIIASTLAIGKSPDEIIKIYSTYSSSVFNIQEQSGYGAVKSYYDTRSARVILQKIFESSKLRDTQLPVAFCATNVGRAEGRIFTSWEDGDQSLVDVVTASCAAPYYFDPELIDGELFADGGLWANNPSLAGYSLAVGRFNIAPENIRLLSLGTGYQKQYFSPSQLPGQSWGLVQWRPNRFIKMLIESQSFGSEQLLTNIIPKNAYVRVNFFDQNLPSIDEYQRLEELCVRADQSYNELKPEILSLFK